MPKLRRLSGQETPAALAQLAQAGGTARSVESWAQDHMTALILGESPEISALMPMACRTIMAAPGRELRIGWLSSNQFASRMSWRRQTRDTAGEWPQLLPELNALFVMRRDDAPSGWAGGAPRWYAQTGFCDVLSIRCLYLDMQSPPDGNSSATAAGPYQVHVVSPEEGQWDAAAWQEQMLAVYRDVYAACGGAPLRSATFWQSALASHFYRDHYQFQIIGLWNPGANPSGASAGSETPVLMGYAIVGWSGWHSKRPRMDILELATRQWDTAVAADLIRTTCQLAWSKSVRQVRAVISAHDPYRGHLARTGFIDRWGYRMLAKWLHAQRWLDQIGQNLPPELGDFWVQLAMPGEVPLTLGRGARSSPASSVTLQGDARMVSRLLLSRADIAAALQEGTLVSAAPLSDRDLARLSVCFPWTPWVFHMLDYI